jgi:hypothetical protein
MSLAMAGRGPMRRPSSLSHTFLILGGWLTLCASAQAQTQKPSASPTPEPRAAAAQTELNLVSLPTTGSLRRHHGYFRLTHRFARDLTLGDFSDLAADAFAFDNGAVLGLEYRFALEDDIQVGVHRSTLNKALQLFGRWDAWKQGASPVGLSAFASFEALDNLQDGHQPGAGLVMSRTWGATDDGQGGPALALYASPTFVYGTLDAERIASGMSGHVHTEHLAAKPLTVHAADGEVHDEHAGHKSTLFVGLGARLRLRPTVYAAAEFSPRLRGHDPGDAMWGASLEKVTRGHTLALTLTNTYATTPGQIARGGTPGAMYLGFNIIRKF